MADFLTALAVIALLITATMVAAMALGIRALTRANRVAPKRRSAAPLSWLVSPRTPARLHRRLRRAVHVTDFAVGTVAPAAMALKDVAGELVHRAVTADDWLVAAAVLHAQARRYRLAQLTAEVRDIETTAARLHHLSCDWRRGMDEATGMAAGALPDLHQRLDAVEAALRELPVPAARATQQNWATITAAPLRSPSR